MPCYGENTASELSLSRLTTMATPTEEYFFWVDRGLFTMMQIQEDDIRVDRRSITGRGYRRVSATRASLNHMQTNMAIVTLLDVRSHGCGFPLFIILQCSLEHRKGDVTNKGRRLPTAKHTLEPHPTARRSCPKYGVNFI